MAAHPEKILVVPSGLVAELVPEGYSADPAPLARLLAAGEFRVRDDVEEDERFRQVIAYTVFGDDRVAFAYTRAKAGGEGRLHDLRSIGVGGHIEDRAHADPADTLAVELRRELSEEVEIVVGGHAVPFRFDTVPPPVGLINDPTDPVGRVHLAVVYRLPWVGGLRAREDHLAAAAWVGGDELLRDRAAFEGWSRLLIREFFGRADEWQFRGRYHGVFGQEADPGRPPLALFRRPEHAAKWLAAMDHDEDPDDYVRDVAVLRADVYGSYWSNTEETDPKAAGFEDFTVGED